MSKKHTKTEECMDISLECADAISMDNFTLKTPTRRITKKLSPTKHADGISMDNFTLKTPTRRTKKLSPKKRTAKIPLLTKLTTKKLSNREKRPPNKVRYDQMNHYPQADGLCNATRCKNEGCVQKTHFTCIKCGIHLCIKNGRNCFKEFHELF